MPLPSPWKAASGPLPWSALRACLSLPVLLLMSCTDMGVDPSERSSSLEHALPDRPGTKAPRKNKLLEETAPEALVWSGRAWLEPMAGTYFGANLDFHHDTMGGFNGRLGHNSADFVQFVGFPMDDGDEWVMSSFLVQVAQHQGLAIATFEPVIPLWDITQDMAEELADYFAYYNEQYEMGILIRFAHEMNGSWYSWSQQPTEYIRVYRMVAEAIHRKAFRTGMLWAPSYPGGYPFGRGPYEAHPGDPDFPLLDTDGDGELTMNDDAYLPYYPGDEYVDWVGLSLYHWGSAYPWGENELPEDHKFVDQIMGTYDGLAGDETGLTNFYATFTEQHGKPMAIVETAALYNPGRGGPGALEIKRAWWEQVFSDEVFDRFPRLRMINWFEWDKYESEINWERIDWTVTVDSAIRQEFLDDFPTARLLFGPIPVEDTR